MNDITVSWLWSQFLQDIQSVERDVIGGTVGCNYHFHMTYGDNTENIIFDEYNKIRLSLKNRFYSSLTDSAGKPNLIDQHKIAACFCKAFIKRKVFSFDINEKTPAQMLLSNYSVAYRVSLRIIYLYLLDYYVSGDSGLSKYESNKCIERLQSWKTLKVPSTSNNHDSYNLGRIKTLALNDYYKIDLDLLTYADMMYWIELYNKFILEGKIHLHDE